MELKLKAYQNRDYGVRWLPKAQTVHVTTFEHAHEVFRAWIEENDLGGGNVGETKILDNGKLVAYISYNGRLWTTEKNWSDRKEIKLAAAYAHS
jgi:glutamine cyclotransferase